MCLQWIFYLCWNKNILCWAQRKSKLPTLKWVKYKKKTIKCTHTKDLCSGCKVGNFTTFYPLYLEGKQEDPDVKGYLTCLAKRQELLDLVSRYPSLKSLRSVKPIFSLWDIFSKTIVSSLTKIQIATAAATACAGLIIIVHQIDNVTILETNGCYSLPTRRWYPICFIPLFKQTDVGGAQFMFLTDFVIQNFGCIRHINGDSFHWAYLRLNSQDL